MMSEAIKKFAEQFNYEPEIQNAENLPDVNSYLLTGMGGSHLSADMLFSIKQDCEFASVRDYGMPEVAEEKMKQSLMICSSYSGNTEEVLEAYDEAREKNVRVAVIAAGGKLVENAKRDGVPYIIIPNTGIQPRSALGFSFLALLKMMGEDELLREAQKLADVLKPDEIEEEGKKLAEKVKDCVPIVYSSRRNEAVARNWKIKFNETGKIPSFYNVLPELNHNEMTGFDVADSSKHLSENFYFIFLKDSDDHPQVQKRMDVTADMYRKRGFRVDVIEMKGNSRLEKMFASLLLADWTAVHIADMYGLESEQVPMVEEFKKLIV